MDKLIARSSFALLLALGLAACGSEAATSDEMPAPVAAPPEAEDEAPEGDPSVPRAEQTQQPAGATVRQPKSNEPAPKACLDQLKDLGIPFEPTQARGVIDAVTVKGRIGGIMFASEEKTTPAQSPMACEFVLTLNKFAAVLKAKGVDRIGTLGSYCYRCCCSWSETNQCRSLNDPEPTCSNGYSNHSWGRAIDIRYVYTTKGERFDINDAKTWVVSPSSGTCTTGLSKQTGASKFLRCRQGAGLLHHADAQPQRGASEPLPLRHWPVRPRQGLHGQEPVDPPRPARRGRRLRRRVIAAA
jgi:hypothetical protein